MNPLFSHLKTGLATFGVLAALAAPSLAGPASMAGSLQPVQSKPAAMPDVTQIRCFNNNDCFNSNKGWRVNRDGVYHRDFSAKKWNKWNNNNWNNDNWRWKKRHYRHNYRGGSGLYFGLGLGAPYLYNNYYDRYDYQPRRVYRTESLSDAHVRWCYNHYKTYRASDNTYVPRRGVRAQCWSPYS